jgi:hypothetical protein
MAEKRKADDAFASLGAEISDEGSLNSGSKRRISCNHSEDGDDDYVEESCLSLEIPVPSIPPPSPPTPPPSDLTGKISSSHILRRLTEKNNALIASRRRSLCLSSERLRAAKRFGSRTTAAVTFVSVKQQWRLYLSTIDPLFFHQSTLEKDGGSEMGRRTGGRSAYTTERAPHLRTRAHGAQNSYAALRINEENNEDVAELFRKKWASKALRGQPLHSYAQLRACAGQFLRFCVTLKLVEADAVCDRGSLFHLVCEIDIVQGFVSFWQARAVCSTVYSKVCQLKVLLHESWAYFGMVNDTTRRHKAREVNEYILSVAAAEKTETRRLSSGRRAVDVRATEGKLFLPKDFEFCIKRATNILSGVMDTSMSLLSSRGAIGLSTKFTRCPALVQKWNINLIALLLLTAGGQRPQVFAQLKCPDGLSLAEIRQQLSGASPFAADSRYKPDSSGSEHHERGDPHEPGDCYFELGVIIEKRQRSSRLPNVLFPSLTFRYVEFHCKYVLPHIRANSRRLERDNCRNSSQNNGTCAGESLDERRNDGVEETDAPENRNYLSQDEFEDGDEAALLLHTESARPIGARQVGATWKRFVCDVDPELSGVTPMVLRASFATYMIHLYRTGKHFRGYSELAFIDRLAALMNTSAEMLANVYGGCDMDDYRATASEMMRIYERGNADENGDHAEGRLHAHAVHDNVGDCEDEERNGSDNSLQQSRCLQYRHPGAHFSRIIHENHDYPSDTREESARTADRIPRHASIPQESQHAEGDDRPYEIGTVGLGNMMPRGSGIQQRSTSGPHYRYTRFDSAVGSRWHDDPGGDTREGERRTQRRITFRDSPQYPNFGLPRGGAAHRNTRMRQSGRSGLTPSFVSIEEEDMTY